MRSSFVAQRKGLILINFHAEVILSSQGRLSLDVTAFGIMADQVVNYVDALYELATQSRLLYFSGGKKSHGQKRKKNRDDN